MSSPTPTGDLASTMCKAYCRQKHESSRDGALPGPFPLHTTAKLLTTGVTSQHHVVVYGLDCVAILTRSIDDAICNKYLIVARRPEHSSCQMSSDETDI